MTSHCSTLDSSQFFKADSTNTCTGSDSARTCNHCSPSQLVRRKQGLSKSNGLNSHDTAVHFAPHNLSRLTRQRHITAAHFNNHCFTTWVTWSPGPLHLDTLSLSYRSFSQLLLLLLPLWVLVVQLLPEERNLSRLRKVSSTAPPLSPLLTCNLSCSTWSPGHCNTVPSYYSC